MTDYSTFDKDFFKKEIDRALDMTKLLKKTLNMENIEGRMITLRMNDMDHSVYYNLNEKTVSIQIGKRAMKTNPFDDEDQAIDIMVEACMAFVAMAEDKKEDIEVIRLGD